MAFNFLVGEVCQALDQGIEAENPYIQSRWGKAASRTYVSRLLRSMGNGDLFTKSWHSVPDEASGRNKRRRTFYLDQENPLVKITLEEHGQVTVAEPSPEDELPVVSVEDSGENSGDAPEAEPPAGGTDAPFLLRLFRPNR